jgi:integrase
VLDGLEEQRKLTGNRKHHFLTVNGQKMTPDPIRKEVWTPALEKAGIDYRPPLQTRHTFATMVLSAGEDVGWVQNRSDKRFTNLVPMDEYRRKKKSSGILLSP